MPHKASKTATQRSVPPPPDKRLQPHQTTHHTSVNRRRIERGMTTDQLALMAGLSLRTVKSVIAGGMCATRVHRRIAAALEIDPLVLWPELITRDDVITRIQLAPVKRRAWRHANDA